MTRERPMPLREWRNSMGQLVAFIPDNRAERVTERRDLLSYLRQPRPPSALQRLLNWLLRREGRG